MTVKKQRWVRAKKIRSMVRVPFVLSQRLARCETTYQFIDTLNQEGYHVQEIAQGKCHDDGCTYGVYRIFFGSTCVGEIPFSCCGIEIA